MTEPHSEQARGTSKPPDDALPGMTREELMRAGAEAGGVRVLHRRERFPIPGTKAEKRAERQVATAFAVTFVAAVGFMVCYVAVPWHIRYGDPNSYRWFTPALGVCMGVALLSVGFGAVMWAKKLMPEEVVVQDRHDPDSTEFEKATFGATMTQALQDSGLPRRSLLKRALGAGVGALGVMAIFPLGGVLRKPRSTLLGTPWGVNTRMIQVDGTPIGPADLQPGSLATVFPDVPGGLTSIAAPVMLIRLRAGVDVKPRRYQADFNWGDYYAFSKICTHAGCPVSLYEQQTNRLLCPCHQSQFDILLDAKPVFGPAARPLPQLPITVDSDGHFVSRRDFIEPIGPSFWERHNLYTPSDLPKS